MQKAGSIPSAGTEADSEQKVENIFVSSHDTKPNVVGSQCHGTSLEILKEVNSKINKLIVEFEKEYGEKVIAIGSVQRPGQHKSEERVELIMAY